MRRAGSAGAASAIRITAAGLTAVACSSAAAPPLRVARLLGVLLLLAVLCIHPARGQAGESGDSRSADLAAVEAVCGRCHPDTAFLHSPRSWSRWNDVFEQMSARGATGTDEQLERVTRYFLENLTVININTSPPDQIAAVLGVSREVANAVVARRAQRKFVSRRQLGEFPGLDPGRLRSLGERLLF